jgi:LPS O-antigen subunit length determinant protein (WzzB/FepE family)
VVASVAKGQDPKQFEDIIKSLEGAKVEGVDPEKVKQAKEAYGNLIQRMENPAPSASGQIQIVQPNQPDQNARLEMTGSPSSISLSAWQEQQLAQLTRDYEVKSANYRQLQQRMERARTTRRLGESDEGLKFKILEPARLPLRPYKPNMFKLGMFGLFLGMFVGAGLVFLVEYLDQSFQSAEELQVAMALPVLGSISTIVTEADLEEQREKMKHWLSIKNHTIYAVKTVRENVTRQVDNLLVRWKV